MKDLICLPITVPPQVHRPRPRPIMPTPIVLRIMSSRVVIIPPIRRVDRMPTIIAIQGSLQMGLTIALTSTVLLLHNPIIQLTATMQVRIVISFTIYLFMIFALLLILTLHLCISVLSIDLCWVTFLYTALNFDTFFCTGFVFLFNEVKFECKG